MHVAKTWNAPHPRPILEFPRPLSDQHIRGWRILRAIVDVPDDRFNLRAPDLLRKKGRGDKDTQSQRSSIL